MKNLTTLLVCFLFAFNSYSQEMECQRFLNPDEQRNENQINYRNDIAVASSQETFVFNVKIHFVKNTNGTGETFGNDQVQDAMMILNETYNKFKIYFKLAGFDYINNSNYIKIRSTNKKTNPNHPTINELVSYSKTGMDVPVYDEKALNMYVVENINENPVTFGSGTNGIGYLPGTVSFFTYKSFLSTTLLHEIGHNFNLEHTYNLSGTSQCELVSGENAEFSGDYVIDTPATPLIMPTSDYSSSCSYVNSMKLKDCAGEEFKGILLTNIMGHDNPCRDLSNNYEAVEVHFTNGQGVRMRNYIKQYISNPQNMYGYNKAKTTLEELYKPTQQFVNVSSEQLEITENEDEPGIANICKKTDGILYEFQKGFKYKLTCNDGSTKIFNTNQTPKIVVNKSFNVEMDEISKSKSFFVPVDYVEGLQCEKQKYISISIATTNDLANGSIHVKELSGDEINCTNIFNSLSTKTYNIINKETASGLKITKKIYKY